MKLAITVKNSSKAIKPTKNDVVVFDGDSWYITTKEDILKENKQLLEECKRELAEMKETKKQVASQLLEMSELIKKLYSK